MSKIPENNSADSLIDYIRDNGPVSVHEYMSRCLSAYYSNKDPLGRDGDFITAPEISQMFGELIGVWAAETWNQMGQPGAIKLIEAGPGRGTLMSDALRACKALPQFLQSLSVHLVEVNEALREKQRKVLSSCGVEVHHYGSLSEIEDGPSIIIANEFFDALPVRQLQWSEGRWVERCVSFADDGLQFCIFEVPVDDKTLQQLQNLTSKEPEEGDIFEYRERCLSVIEEVSRREKTALLLIDYGHEESGYGDSLQAVREHKYAEVLSDPGLADLTTQVDFNQLAKFSENLGLSYFGPMTQGQFLLMLGLEQRLNQLSGNATEDQRELLKSGAIRLVAPEQMGVLFKVMCIQASDLPKPVPFP